jgi:hypothetical protein
MWPGQIAPNEKSAEASSQLPSRIGQSEVLLLLLFVNAQQFSQHHYGFCLPHHPPRLRG